MTSERVTSGTKVALLSAALLLLLAACGEQAPEENKQSAAPTSQEPATAATGDTGQATEGEKPQQ